MTNPETEAKTSDVGAAGSSTESSGSVFLEKVSDIPVVSAAKEYGAAVYNQVKQMNQLTSLTLSKAEATILYLALTAKPFLEKVQPQAKIVDDMACRGLEAVEARAPFIKKTPEELVEEARKLCISTMESGMQKVDGLKAMGTEALSSVRSYSVEKANDCLAGTENLVDRYIPAAFNEVPQDGVVQDPTSIVDRATQLTAKVSNRVYGHGIKQFINMQRLSQESIAKLIYTVELLQTVKENYAQRSVQDYVDDAKVKATWIWDELNKEPTVPEEANRSLEHRMLSLARRLTSTLVYTYSVASTTLPIAEVSQACAKNVQSASAYAAELFTQFDQAVNSGEVTSTLLQRTRNTIASLDAVVRTMLQNFQEKETMEMKDLSSTKNAEQEQSLQK